MTKVLFVSSFHPDGSGNIGAGEMISGDSVRRFLASGAEVHVFCVVPTYQRASEELERLCASYTVIRHSAKLSLQAIFKNFFFGALIAPWFFTRVSPQAITAIRNAIAVIRPDEVWFDFPSSLGFVCQVDAPCKVYFAHDIVSQKIRRSPLKRFLGPMVRRVEKGLLGRLSRIVALSDKDALLARELGFARSIDVWPPSQPRVGVVDDFTPIGEVIACFGEGPNMVFFGHMGRSENHWSIVLFILGCYGKIRKAFPGVRLWIIGVQPRFLLKLLAKITPGVEVVGAVDDPALAFVNSTVCIAPILFGAGVKIKVLQMLDAGASVVATPIGAEGIDKNDRLMVVEWSALSSKIIGILTAGHADA